MDSKLFDQAFSLLRGGLRADLGRDLENNLRSALRAMFDRLDLVSRDEFDVQQAVLARTRAKLTALERQVAELEKQQSKQ